MTYPHNYERSLAGHPRFTMKSEPWNSNVWRSNPNAWVKSPANPRRTAVHINFRDVWNFEMTVFYPPWKSEFMTYPVTILYAHLFTFAVENRSLLVYFADSILPLRYGTLPLLTCCTGCRMIIRGAGWGGVLTSLTSISFTLRSMLPMSTCCIGCRVIIRGVGGVY